MNWENFMVNLHWESLLEKTESTWAGFELAFSGSQTIALTLELWSLLGTVCSFIIHLSTRDSRDNFNIYPWGCVVFRFYFRMPLKVAWRETFSWLIMNFSIHITVRITQKCNQNTEHPHGKKCSCHENLTRTSHAVAAKPTGTPGHFPVGSKSF